MSAEVAATRVAARVALKSRRAHRNRQRDAGSDEKALDVAVINGRHVLFLLIGCAAPSGASDRSNSLSGAG
jgi:hypothetical protein